MTFVAAELIGLTAQCGLESRPIDTREAANLDANALGRPEGLDGLTVSNLLRNLYKKHSVFLPNLRAVLQLSGR